MDSLKGLSELDAIYDGKDVGTEIIDDSERELFDDFSDVLQEVNYGDPDSLPTLTEDDLQFVTQSARDRSAEVRDTYRKELRRNPNTPLPEGFTE